MEMTLQDYLRSDWTPDAEFVDGTIEERHHGDEPHSSWMNAIMFWFQLNGEAWDILIRPSLRIQISPTIIRVPDVSIWDPAGGREQIPTRPPIAAFEIWNPEDSVCRLIRKLNDYQQMGVEQIWLIDPADPVWMCFEDGRLVERDTFNIHGRQINFKMTEIHRRLR